MLPLLAGFLQCLTCDGSGTNDDGGACRNCHSLGATPCDFCSGSGLAGYAFFPNGIELELATRRLAMASQSLHSLGTPGLADVKELQLIDAYRKLVRIRGIYSNSLQLMRELRNQDKGIVAHIVTKAWCGLARTENDLGLALNRLANMGDQSKIHAADSDFQDERKCLLEQEATRLTESARNRAHRLKYLAAQHA